MVHREQQARIEMAKRYAYICVVQYNFATAKKEKIKMKKTKIIEKTETEC